MHNSMNIEGDHTRDHETNPSMGNTNTRSQSHSTMGSLIGALWRDTSDLAAQQAELVKAEAAEKITKLALGAGAIAASGAVILAGLIVLLLAAVNALIPFFDHDRAAWLAPLIVGAVVIAVGYAMFTSGRKAFSAQYLKPTRTIETMRRNTEMVKEHTK